MNLDLSNRKAIVCGSSQGIGFAAASELAQLGATVTLFARNAESLAAACQKLPRPGQQKHRILVADFSDIQAVQLAIKNWLAEEGSAQILVNNTGGPPAGPAIIAKVDDFLQAFRNHLAVNQTLVQSLVDGMKSAQYGRIINVISTSVKQPIENLGVSNTVRGAVANWSKTLAMELAAFGITVNNVLPGATKTARLESIIANTATKHQKSTDEVETALLRAIPAGRFGEASEIGAAIAFLASPAASYINGINLPVDGGRTQCL